MPTPVQIEEQVKLERYGIEKGRKDLLKNIAKLEEQSYASATPYGHACIREALPLVIDAINKHKTTLTRNHFKGKDAAVITPVLEVMDTESIALIGLKVAIDLVCRHKDFPKLTFLLESIGVMVEAEARLRWYEQQDDGRPFDNIKKKYWHSSAGTKQKIRLTSILMKRRGYEFKPWSTAAKVKFGGFVLDKIQTVTGWFDNYTKYRKPTLVIPTAEFLEIKGGLIAAASRMAGQVLPMVSEPNNWDGSGGGGGGYYLSHPCFGNRSMIKQSSHQSTPFQGGPPVDFLNRLQRTEYCLNPVVVETALTLDKRGIAVGKFLPVFEIPLPPKPFDIATNEEARKSYRRECAETMNKNAQMFRRNCRTRMTLEQVKMFYGKYEKFYLPWNFDYRGRCYPLPPFMTPQDTDFGKSLLKFYRPMAVNDEVRYWLAFQVATAYGLDKATMADRQEWAKLNAKLIEAVAIDPLVNRCEWEVADEPWQFLAACDEYYHCVIAGDRKTTNLPVAVDATCSGLQILAGLTRDHSTAQLVNVFPGDKPQDAYRAVASKAAELLTADGRADLAGMLDRKVTKRTVMTIPYNATKHSNRGYIREALREKGAELEPGDLSLITNAVRSAMASIVPGAMSVMDWIKREVSKAIRERGAKELKWKTPSGFTVVQRLNVQNTTEIKLQVLGRMKMMVADGDKPDQPELNRHKASTAPNFIHSLDASLLHLAFLKFNKPFTVIHDSVLCRAGDMTELNKIVRETYCDIFKGNVLQDFADAIGAETPPPMVGDLDLNQVTNSTYFFS